MSEERLALRQAYGRVFTGPDGEAVLADLLRQSNVLTRPPPTITVESVVFAEGARSVGLHLIEQLGLDALDAWTRIERARRADSLANQESHRVADL